MSERRNALATETSPYLLQHADNPVQWYPWGDQALAMARTQNKPILLSIGYSACHWCHVMAHESFEHDATAELMNKLFVNIKVDREERPDLDKIYQLSHQLLTQRAGGWPLTMFLTPSDHKPFFGGTYFPLESRFGMPAFTEVLTRVEAFFRTHTDEISRQNQSLADALARLEPRAGGSTRLSQPTLDNARNQLGQLFEPEHGGFGHAPKFPHCTNLERLLRHYAQTAIAGQPDTECLHMVAFTTAKMASGGLYDQIGGGFCRYSVDDYWMIPHFEKMLYDNGPLLALCAELGQVTDDAFYLDIARETAEWIMREMQSPAGGYYSTIDADSEGVEGKYYVWIPAEVEALLTADEYVLVSHRFGLNRPANFEGEFWHFHVFEDSDEIERATGFGSKRMTELWTSARDKLFHAREQRIRPGLDDKILTSWNGLMIKGMAIAARALDDDRLTDSAFAALDYVRGTLWSDGRLLATARDGQAHLTAYLDDYAFMIDGVLNLLQTRWRDGDLSFAIELAEVLLTQFEDTEDGGFYFTSHGHETLMHRHKPLMDDAVPAGNGIAAQMLGRLGHLLGENRYLAAAERTLQLAADAIERIPHAHNALTLALEEYLHPVQTIVLRGQDDALREWHRRCSRAYAPRRLCLAIPSDAAPPGLLAQRTPRANVVAYVCEGHECGPPFENLDELMTHLAKSEVEQTAVNV